MKPETARKLAAALEHSADHDRPEDKRKVMFSVARSLYELAATRNVAEERETPL